MPADEPLAHIARSPLPWRDPTDNDTECGKPVSEFAKVITWGDAVALVNKHGQQRAAFMLCMTCAQTSERHGWRANGSRHGQLTFDDSPTARIEREFGKRREQSDRELRAMAELVKRHRQEFDDLLAGRIVPIAELRRTKQGDRRARRGVDWAPHPGGEPIGQSQYVQMLSRDINVRNGLCSWHRCTDMRD
ncbi:MAG: hypothetical protein WC211_03880 [Dehalococcoidia bacterium]